jgi:hypothetical protein
VIVRGPSSERPSYGMVMRRHHLLRAVARVAALDVFVMNAVNDAVLEEMSATYGARVGCVRSPMVPLSRIGRIVQSLRHPGSPARRARRDWQAARRDLRPWMGTYRLTVVELADDFRVLAPILPPPVVVDLEEQRWLRVERFVLKRADRIVVASTEDAAALGNRPKTVVVPNGFELHGAPAASREVHAPPTISFWGLMSYGPNRDGAEWLISKVLPALEDRSVRRRLIENGAARAGALKWSTIETDFAEHLARMVVRQV